MAALTAPRNTPMRHGDILGFAVAAATTIHQGSLVVIDAGYAVPGRAAAGLIAAGRAEHNATAVLAGDAQVEVRTGTFFFDIDLTDPVTQANVGTDCYVVDDQTVAATDGGGARSRAGIVTAVESTGVWVQIGLGL